VSASGCASLHILFVEGGIDGAWGAGDFVTIDVPVEAEMWLLRDYVPEIAERDLVEFPTIDAVCGWLGGASVEVLPVPSDCHDGFLLSFWSQPERVLDASSRAATSGFARLADDVVTRAVDSLAADLGDGTWCRRHGDLRQLTEYDAGLRLVVADFAF